MAFKRYVILALSFFIAHANAQFAGTFKHGVNIGGWLVAESWMYPMRWKQMGGERCDQNRSTCISSEWALVHKLGQERANEVFLDHWQTWFTQEYVDRIKAVKLDHVRIPLGFWIIEELLQPPVEMYAQGGWMELKRGLRQLKQAGLNVLLDMHALPGVSSYREMFAGNYTTEVHFYEDANYRRALTWITILTAMSHLDPDFERVLGIEFINEPRDDASKTPGLGTYYRDAVTTVRVVEYALRTRCDTDLTPALDRMIASNNVIPALKASIPLLRIYAAKADPLIDVSALTKTLESYIHGTRIIALDEVPGDSDQLLISSTRSKSFVSNFFLNMKRNLGVSARRKSPPRSCLTTVAMSKQWQKRGNPESMAPHVLGPRAFDMHIYFSFGGPKGPQQGASYDEYMDSICFYKAYETAQRDGEVPFGTGEFSIRDNFNATRSQVRDWGDGQKLYYAREAYWTFWSFRMEEPTGKGGTSSADAWSYLRAVDRGLLTKDPNRYFNASVCKGRKEKTD